MAGLAECFLKVGVPKEDQADIERLVAENNGDAAAGVRAWISVKQSDLDSVHEQLAAKGLDSPAVEIDSAIAAKKARKERKAPTAEGGADLIALIASRGGIRDDEGHNLRKGRNLNKLTNWGPLIRKGGMSIDAVGELIKDEGYLDGGQEAQRPGESETLAIIEAAVKNPWYIPEIRDAKQAAEAEKAGRQDSDPTEARARAELKAEIERDELTFTAEEFEAILAKMADGTSAEEAVNAWINEASNDVIETADRNVDDLDVERAFDLVADDEETAAPQEDRDGPTPAGRPADEGDAAREDDREAPDEWTDLGDGWKSKPSIYGGDTVTYLSPQGDEIDIGSSGAEIDNRSGRPHSTVEAEFKAKFGRDVFQKDEPPPKPTAAPKAAKPKPAAEKPEPEAGTVEDVGENLKYNRRNFVGKALTWEEIKAMNPALRKREAVKGRIWPKPDYEALVEGGMNPLVARAIKHVYDGIAKEPARSDDAGVKLYVDTVEKVREALFKWANDKARLKEWASAAASALAARGDRSGLISRIADSARFNTQSLLDAIWPETAGQTSYGRFGRGTPQLEEMRAIGGNKPLRAFQIDTDDLVEFTKDIMDGWPKPQEAWQRQGYEIVPTAGKARVAEGTKYIDKDNRETVFRVIIGDSYGSPVWPGVWPTREEAQKFIDDQLPPYVLTRKGRIVGDFKTQEDAVEGARKLTKRERGDGGDIRGMNLSDSERTGPERRENGENKSSQDLMDTFGFRGVNFGRKSYMNDAERQAAVNSAYDALADLAEIMDLPPKALSLNGMLGIAFGAQGSGSFAAAHFVPGVNEINLTKTSGAGTLAHEWGHALDHYFATQAGLAGVAEPFMSAHPGRTGSDSTVRAEIRKAFDEITAIMNKRPMTAEEMDKARNELKARALRNLDSWIRHIREDIAKADDKEAVKYFDELAARLRDGDIGDGLRMAGKLPLQEVVALMRQMVQKHRGKASSVDIKDNWKGLDSAASHMAYVLKQKEAAREHIPQTRTNYLSASMAKDQAKKGKQYWSTATEMFARAFELWVSDRLTEKTQRNTFLSDADVRVDMPDPKTGEGFAFPYPRNEDRKTIGDAIGKMVDAIETRETERGTQMFARRGAGGDAPLRVGTGMLQRGADAIIRRLSMQANLDRSKNLKAQRDGRFGKSPVTQDEIKEIEDFIEWVGAHMVADVGVRFSEQNVGPLGSFEAYEAAVTMFRRAVEAGSLTRTMIHELWHALSRSLPQSDRNALIREYRRQRDAYVKKNPWAKAFVKDKMLTYVSDEMDENGMPVGELRSQEEPLPYGGTLRHTLTGDEARAFLEAAERGEIDWPHGAVTIERDLNSPNPTVRINWSDGNYRFHNVDEFFAETMTDKYFDDRQWTDEKARSIFAHVRDIFRRAVSGLKRLFGRDASGRIFDGFKAGEFQPAPGGNVIREGLDTNAMVGGSPSQTRAINKAIAAPDKRSIGEKIADTYRTLADGLKDEMIWAIADEFHGLRKLGKTLTPNAAEEEYGSYVAATLARHGAGQMEAFLRYGAPVWDDQLAVMKQDDTGGLFDIVKPIFESGKERLFDGYAYARRVKTQGLLGQGREHNLTQAEVDELIDLGNQHPEFVTTFDKLQTFKTKVLDAVEAMGLINRDQRAIWEKADHVPFYRVNDDKPGGIGAPGKKRGLGNQSAGIRKLTGGEETFAVIDDQTGEVASRHETRAEATAAVKPGQSVEKAGQPIVGVIENIARNITTLIDAAMKNHAAQLAVDEAVDAGWAEKVPMAMGQALVPQSAMARTLQQNGINVAGNPQGVAAVMAITSPVKPGNDVVAIRRDGNVEYYRVADKLVYRAIAGIHRAQMSPILKPFAALKNLLTRTVTSMPGFMARNFARDSASSWLISGERGLNFYAEMAKSMKALASSSDTPETRALMAAGGDTGWYQNAPPEMVKQLRDLEKSGTVGVMSYANPRKLFEMYMKLGRASELANRRVTYQSEMRRSHDPRRAAFKSADLLDFQRHGGSDIMQFLTAITPFLNARIQGLYKLGRAGLSASPADRRSFAVKAGMMIGFSLAIAALNMGDDDEGGYNDLPEWIKDGSWVIPIYTLVGEKNAKALGLPRFGLIPKPFELGILFGTVPERMMQLAAGNDRWQETGEALKRAIFSTLEFNPIGNPASKEVFEQWANKDFFTGNPIVPPGMEGLGPEAYTAGTSEAAKAAGKLTGLSPLRIEHAVRGFTGTLGVYTLAAIDAAARAMNMVPSRPEMRLDEMEVVRSFIAADPARGTKWTERFYDLQNEADAILRQRNNRRREGDRSGAKDIQAENKDILSQKKRLDSAARDLAEIRTKMKQVRSSLKLTPAQKREQLEALSQRQQRIAKQTAVAVEKRLH